MNCPDCDQVALKVRSYKVDKNYYLHEYHCKDHGFFICDNNDNFIRKGRIDDHGDDSHITGGRWI